MAMTTAEKDNMAAAFNAMGMKPNAGTADEFTEWFSEHVKNGMVPTHIHLVSFSGDKKSDSTYDLWRYQVGCLRKSHRMEQVMLAVRRSLRGEAARVMMRLGPDVTLDEMLEKLDSVYGIIEGDEALLAEFYAARQQPAENVSMWGCRLEDLLSRVSSGVIPDSTQYDKRLREMYWKGMRSELRDVSGHLFATSETFDQLRVAMRRVEKDVDERNKRPKPAHAVTRDSSGLDSDVKELKAMVAQLTTEVSKLKSDKATEREQRPAGGRGESGWSGGHGYSSGRGYGRGRANGYGRGQGNGYGRGRANGYGRGDVNSANGVCWSCGQFGHLWRDCDLNGQRLGTRGGPWATRRAPHHFSLENQPRTQ